MTAPDPLAQRFLAHVRQRALLRGGEHVLVALSGGLDSVVLLHLLRFAPAHPGWRITAAHFDHAMRPASASDAAWVRGLCRAWGVPLLVERSTAPLRNEADARAARYTFLSRCAALCGADLMATGHQRDDQAETVIFRIARGTGLRGLAGIPERRGPLIRPLLGFGRGELLAYARRRRLRWREDETNRSARFVRNRIRTSLLPALEAARAGAAGRLAELARLAGEAEALWQAEIRTLAREATLQATPDELQLALPVLLEYHPRTRARVMRYLLQRLGGTPGRAGTRVAGAFITSAESGTGIRLGGGIRLEREFDRLFLRRPADSGNGIADRPIRIPAPDAGTARAVVGGAPLVVRWGSEHPAASGGTTASFDPTGLRFPLVLRGWLPGDRIALAYGTKKLKKLFQERRIGVSSRRRAAVLAELGAGGHVLWVVDVARTARVPERGTMAWYVTVAHGESS